MSVTFLPFVRVVVAPPVDREPPAIPILAVVFVSETRRKTGSDEGKVLPTSTDSLAPLTEIRAVVGASAGGAGVAGMVDFFGWVALCVLAAGGAPATHPEVPDEDGSQAVASTC